MENLKNDLSSKYRQQYSNILFGWPVMLKIGLLDLPRYLNLQIRKFAVGDQQDLLVMSREVLRPRKPICYHTWSCLSGSLWSCLSGPLYGIQNHWLNPQVLNPWINNIYCSINCCYPSYYLPVILSASLEGSVLNCNIALF